MPVGALEDGRTVPHAERSLKGTSNALWKLSIQTYLFLLYRIWDVGESRRRPGGFDFQEVLIDGLGDDFNHWCLVKSFGGWFLKSGYFFSNLNNCPRVAPSESHWPSLQTCSSLDVAWVAVFGEWMGSVLFRRHVRTLKKKVKFKKRRHILWSKRNLSNFNVILLILFCLLPSWLIDLLPKIRR